MGFPGEDEEAFQRLVDFVEDFRFERMGAFVYSEPPDTPSAFLYPKVEEKVKQERYKALMEVQEKVMGKFHSSLVGRELEVIVDEAQRGNGVTNFWGRTYGDAPEVDGNISFSSRRNKLKRGEIVKVKVTESSSYELKGEKNLKAAILGIGTELLTGLVRDYNAYFLAQKLVDKGILPQFILFVPDQMEKIVDALQFIMKEEEVKLVIVSGG